MAGPKVDNRIILISVFISGACAMVVELAGARIIAPYVGNSIYTWAAVIGCVLASLSVGYYIGGGMADRFEDRKHFSNIIISASILTLAIPFLGLIILPITLLFDVTIGSLVSSIILIPASVAYGMVSPYAIKLTSVKGAEGAGSGRIFTISTVGSILGTLGTGFILIPNLLISNIFIIAAIAMFICGIASRGRFRGEIIDFIGVSLLILFILALPRAEPFPGTVIHEEDSAYYHITVLDTNWSGSEARILMLDGYPESGEYANGSPAFDYVLATRSIYGFASNSSSALLIGVGGGTQISEMERFLPKANITGVEIDPKTVEIGKDYFSLRDLNRTSIVIGDARRYVLATPSTYDFVSIDVYHGYMIPYHLTSREFLLELKSKMSKDGIVVMNIISPLQSDKPTVLSYLYSTYSSVFNNVAVLPIGHDPGQTQNILMIASDRDLNGLLNSSYYNTGLIRKSAPLTDELNPIDVLTQR